MSASTRVYVRVLKLESSIVEVYAITLQDAREQVARMPDVARVLDAAYEEEDLPEETI